MDNASGFTTKQCHSFCRLVGGRNRDGSRMLHSIKRLAHYYLTLNYDTNGFNQGQPNLQMEVTSSEMLCSDDIFTL